MSDLNFYTLPKKTGILLLYEITRGKFLAKNIALIIFIKLKRMKKQYSVRAEVTYQFHIESEQDKDIPSEELQEMANDALWGNHKELLEVEFDIQCDGQSENQDADAINIDD